LTLAAAGSVALASPFAIAADNDAERIEELDQKIKVLERKLEIQQEDSASKAKTAPVVKAGDKGFSLESADGLYSIKFKALVQADGRFFVDDDKPVAPANASTYNDGFLFRRIRPTFEGTLGPYIGYRITPEFAPDSASLVDAYVDLKLSPAYTLRAGRVKGPISLERLQSGGAITFAERAYPSELAPNRDVGVQLQGDLLDNRISYVVGLYNGTPDGRDSSNASDRDDSFEKAGRVFFQPFVNDADSALQGLGFGLSASQGRKDGAGDNFLPRYRSPGQVQVFNYRGSGANAVSADGEHSRLSPQFYYYRNAFGLLGEYITSKQVVNNAGQGQDELENKAWQLTASYVLTGEDLSYGKGVARPAQDFDWTKGSWGAFEVAARVSRLEIDDAAFTGGANSYADPAAVVSQADSKGLGLNWYLNGNTKAVLNYTQTSFEGGATAGGDREDEKVIITRLQYQF
jgi:phosphate-selective porin OprO/OprP